MDWGTIIAVFALLIALYGAGLATWQEIKGRRQQESRLTVTISTKPIGGITSFNIFIDVANPTLRQVTVTAVEIVLQDSSGPNIGVIPGPEVPPLPMSLEPGKPLRFASYSNIVADEFRARKLSGKQSIRAQAQDGLGNTFLSEPLSIDVAPAVPG